MANSQIKRAEKALRALQNASGDTSAMIAAAAMQELIEVIRDLDVRVRIFEQGSHDQLF
jgi:multidrug resistance efflux pump